MKVKNRACIRRLSFRTLWASRRRNLIAVLAIALTTLMFTALFTVAMSINASYETYTFRQIGGYCHGTFKDVTEEQASAITGHPKVKEVGKRQVLGFLAEGVFAKIPAEISYMDENCTKWSYAEPTVGHQPESAREITMDTESLRLLGIEPKAGTQITLTYMMGDKNQISCEKTDTFTLTGWWEYDEISPVHYEDADPVVWMTEEAWKADAGKYISGENLDMAMEMLPRRDGLVGENSLIEGLDEELMKKLTVIEGDLEPLLRKDSHGIALAVETDDYGNVSNQTSYPAIGDTVKVTYVEDAWYIDSRTGEKCDENTPEEYLEYYIAGSHEVDYTVCAYVEVPHSMSFRYGKFGYSCILSAQALKEDSSQAVIPMFYLFDTPDAEAEAEAEAYLSDLTEGDLSGMMYESKAGIREEFESFREMFLLVGGLLCGIIGLVGILNFVNAIMIGTLLEKMFWFYSTHFVIWPVLLAIPIFALLGSLIPSLMYRQTTKQSIVERLRET